MGDRTIELTITDGHTEEEESRAARQFVFVHFAGNGPFSREEDAELSHYLFAAHDEDGDEYVVAISTPRSEQIWAQLWIGIMPIVIVDRAFAMKRIPQLPEVHG